MNALLLQILLLFATAFFVGAALACGVRKLFAPERSVADMRAAAVRPTVDPLPRMASTDRVPAHENVSRFEKALGSEPPRPAPPPPLSRPQPTLPPIAPPPIAQTRPVVEPPAPAAAPAHVAKAHTHAPVVPPTPHQPVELVVPPPPRLPTATVAATVVPAAVVATVASVTPAPVAQPVVVAPVAITADDLTRIRGIDKTIATALNGLGITRYSQIANWMRPDVSRVNQTMGFKGRVEHENWIEQAQILAGGGQTMFSRRLLTGAQPTPTQPAVAAPVTAPVQPGIVAAAATVAAAAAAVTPHLEPVVVESAPAPRAIAPVSAIAAASAPVSGAITAGVAAAAAAAAAAAQSASHLRAAAPTAPMKARSAEVAERAAFADRPAAAAPVASAIPAPGPAERPLSAGPPAGTSQSPIVLPSVTPLRPSMTPARDPLQRISGINAEIERLLNVQGITRYSQIAGWGSPDVERFDRLLGSPGRVRRESWIEQAQILARGGDTSGARAFDAKDKPGQPMTAASAVPPPPSTPAEFVARPARLPDAIAAQQAAVPAAATPSSRNDISGLRSVKSEAFQSRPADGARSGRLDDLKRIRGIGVLIEKRLNAMGVTGYGQIANWTADDISRFSQQLEFKGRIERENWVEQARILDAGGFTEFSRRLDDSSVTARPRV